MQNVHRRLTGSSLLLALWSDVDNGSPRKINSLGKLSDMSCVHVRLAVLMCVTLPVSLYECDFVCVRLHLRVRMCA